LPSRAFSATEEANRVLLNRLRCGGPDVDALGIRPCASQQTGVDAMVVDHDVCGFEVALAAHADQRRIAGPGSHDVYAG
jgi:hypothetical protein